MDIEGRLIIDLGITSGTSKAGNPWKKRECVIETFGQYPRKVKFHIFGDRVDTIRLEQGKDYRLSFDLESREFNGRWYTDVSVFRAQDYVPAPNDSFGNSGGFDSQYGGQMQNPTPGYGANNMNFGGQGFPNNFEPQNEDSEEDLPF